MQPSKCFKRKGVEAHRWLLTRQHSGSATIRAGPGPKSSSNCPRQTDLPGRVGPPHALPKTNRSAVQFC
eukprot:jgi/Botrbrau1/10808/Bobra.0064s0014.1